jgi:hypothetical protein
VNHKKNRPWSVGAFVGTTNKRDDPELKFWSNIVPNEGESSEILPRLQPVFLDYFKAYFDLHKGLPDNIIIFRDGVGDSQVTAVVFVSCVWQHLLKACYFSFVCLFVCCLLVVEHRSAVAEKSN